MNKLKILYKNQLLPYSNIRYRCSLRSHYSTLISLSVHHRYSCWPSGVRSQTTPASNIKPLLTSNYSRLSYKFWVSGVFGTSCSVVSKWDYGRQCFDVKYIQKYSPYKDCRICFIKMIKWQPYNVYFMIFEKKSLYAIDGEKNAKRNCFKLLYNMKFHLALTKYNIK